MNRPQPTDPATPLLGIEIGGTKLQLVLADAPGAITQRLRLTADRGGGAAIRRQIELALPELLAGRRVRAAAVGFGGPVDRASGRIATSHQVEGWDGFELRDWAASLVGGAPVVVENDSNTAALGEATHGAGRRFDPCFYCNFGSGVGGGLVVGGDIYRAATPGEVEFGHLRLDRLGTTVEDRCSGWAVDRRVRSAASVAVDADSPLARLAASAPAPGGEARFLAEALAHDDPLARRLLVELADDLAFALSHAIHLLHPRVIVIGGGLSLVGEPLRSAIEVALPAYVMRAFHPPTPIRIAGLGEDSVPIGAIELASRVA
ncbi:MAG TPA: ROK family protein [Humisphaera sp.]